MSENNPTDILAAFEMLLEEIEEEVMSINQAGASAFGAGDYDRARQVLAQAGQLTGFRDKVLALRREWQAMALPSVNVPQRRSRPQASAPAAPSRPSSSTGDAHSGRRNLGRVPRGARVIEDAYYRPILEALEEMGGRGKVGDVLSRVERSMKGVLTSVDYQPLKSNSDVPRWSNAAQWARHSLVGQGLLRSDSPRGVWEITDQGRRYLQENRK